MKKMLNIDPVYSVVLVCLASHGYGARTSPNDASDEAARARGGDRTVLCFTNRTKVEVVDRTTDHIRGSYQCPGPDEPKDHTLCCKRGCCPEGEDVPLPTSKPRREQRDGGNGQRDTNGDRVEHPDVVMVAVITSLSALGLLTIVLIICLCWKICPLYKVFRRTYTAEGIVFSISPKPASNIAMTSMVKLPSSTGTDNRNNVLDRAGYTQLPTNDGSHPREDAGNDAPITAENENYGINTDEAKAEGVSCDAESAGGRGCVGVSANGGVPKAEEDPAS